MFDIGWTELLLIGVVALIVVGPKDLPKMFRTLGQLTAKARNMAREFQRAMEDAADATGVKDVAQDLRKATNPQAMGLDELKSFKHWDPLKSDPKGAVPKSDPEEDMDRVVAELERLKASRTTPANPPAAPATDPAQAETSAPSASDTPKT
ncbi:MAG: Sec-independent protein translocase protein TatB [Roseinatronobacter sp.]